MAKDKQSEAELRKEFFDGPASDTMSLEQFFMRNGRGDLVKSIKMKDGGEVFSMNSEYYKEFL